MMTDAMKPAERMAAYGRGEPIDRLPCVPIVANGAARVTGCKISGFKGNGKLMARAQIDAYKLFRYDAIRIFTDLYVQAEAMGAKVIYPEDETAHLEAPAIDDISLIDTLQVPDPHKDGNLPSHLEALKIVLDEVGKEVPVSAGVIGSFTNASFLIGTDSLIRFTLRKPEIVHRLCEISTEAAINYARAVIDAGGSPGISEPVSSSTIISPGQFAEFSYPYLKRISDYIHSRGKTVTLHICGLTGNIWDLMVDSGADCISIDNVENLFEAKRKVGHRARIMGNVSPSQIMLQGTVKDVRRATLECIKNTWDSPKGYIVASGCSLPTDTPFENIHAMLDTVREVGWPVRPEKLESMAMELE
jgi:uroporphyrinogen decarboxylase